MRTMKKVLAAGLTAVMAMSLMVGCGRKMTVHLKHIT